MRTRRPPCVVGGCWGLLLYICCLPAAAGVADGGAPVPAAGEEAYTEETFPNPMWEYEACGVKEYSYVCDPSKRLSQYEFQQLNIAIESLSSVDTCLCDKGEHYDSSGCSKAPEHTIWVALVPRIKYSTGGFPDTEKAELTAVRRFAEYLRDTSWWIRDSIVTCSMQAYIVYDIHTGRIWTATNYYGNKVITDDRADKVAKAAKEKHFKYRAIFSEVNYMISKYKEFLEGGSFELTWWKILLIILGSLAAAWVLVCFCYCCCACNCKCGGGSGGGGGGVFGGGSWLNRRGGGCGGGGGGGGCGGGGGD